MEFITLANKDKVKLIKDVLLHPLKINSDKTGVLVETLRTDWKGIYGKDREFFMQYYSITAPGIARDENIWHYHPTIQEDRFLVAKGEIVVAVFDNRSKSSTKGILNLFYMQADKDPYILLITKRVLHGFLVVSKEPAVVLNSPTSIYDPKEESRISFREAQVKVGNGSLFSWDQVRKFFSQESIRSNGKA
ncbi:MAG: dTDP-4-dehydrorhamnose 3,5-epimerase family protein [Patescibacteria group bacterium]